MQLEIPQNLTLPPGPYPVCLTISLLLLVLSETRSFYLGSAGFKILASLSFLCGGIDIASKQLGHWNGGFPASPGAKSSFSMVAGLVFSFIGDVLLIPSQESYYHHKKATSSSLPDDGASPQFKAGVFFFALAHISYIVSFLTSTTAAEFRPTEFTTAFLSCLYLTYRLGILGGSTATPDSWMAIPDDMTWLVRVYVGIIVTMVSVATATDGGWQKILGAWTFMISDLFVAMDVFGKKGKPSVGVNGRPGWKSRAVGWLAYFWAQMLLAGCI